VRREKKGFRNGSKKNVIVKVDKFVQSFNVMGANGGNRQMDRHFKRNETDKRKVIGHSIGKRENVEIIRHLEEKEEEETEENGESRKVIVSI
jgi:hypothetical protein